MKKFLFETFIPVATPAEEEELEWIEKMSKSQRRRIAIQTDTVFDESGIEIGRAGKLE